MSDAPTPTGPGRDPREFLFKVDFVKYMEILSAQRTFIFVFFFSAVLTSLALTYVFSERYQATATIYYRPVDVTLLRQRNAESFGAPVPAAPFRIISQTLNDIVRSEAILRPVVEELGLDKEIKPQYDTWYKAWFHEAKKWLKETGQDALYILKYGRLIEEDRKSAAVEGLRENLSIVTAKESYVFVLSVRDQYPERAAHIVDAVGTRLVDWSRQQDRDPAQSKSKRLSADITLKEEELTALRKERDTILRNSGIASVSEEVNTGVQSQYGIQLELERVVAQIVEKRKRLDELTQTISTRGTHYVDPAHLKRVEEEKLFTEIEVKSLEAKRTAMQASVNRMQGRLQSVLAIKKRIEDIDSKIESANRGKTHISDMQLEAAESTSRDSEVRILHKASVPQKPVQPIKLYHVGLTGLLALFIATGLVYVFSYFNVRVFFPSAKPTADNDPNKPAEAAGG